MIKSKKGQVGLADAPQIVMIVGFVFLIMATIAFVASEYATAIPVDETNTVVNETVTLAERTAGGYLDGAKTDCNPTTFVITNVTNGTTNIQVLSSNYTLTSTTGYFINATGVGLASDWRVTYTYLDSGTACDISQDLNSNLSDNTSIAGIVLTISLIGIVLSVLVGVFVLARRGGM